MNSPKRISICIITAKIPPLFGGGGLRAYRYALRLEKKGYLAFIMTGKYSAKNDASIKWDDFQASDALPQEKIIRLNRGCRGNSAEPTAKLKYIFNEYILLFFLVGWNLFSRRKTYDIIHCFGSKGSLNIYSSLFAKLFRKKIVIEMTLLGQDDPLTIINRNTSRIKKWFGCLLFRLSDVVISLSPALMSAYLSSKLASHKLRKVMNAVDTETFFKASKDQKKHFAGKLGCKDRYPVILNVGAIVKRKRTALVVEIFSKIIKSYPNAMLILAGSTEFEPEYFNNLISYIRDKNLTEHIKIPGLVKNVEDYYKIGDLFLFCSLKEGLPNVVLEAMSSGLPVVTSHIAGITDTIIDHRENGIIISSDTADDYVVEIERLLDNKNFYSYISEKAVLKIKQNFTNDNIDSQYMTIYNDLI